MGKYMRKAKASGEVAVMEVTAAPLGVRTRSRALAMQRLPQEVGKEQGDYLELRGRKLEKLAPPPREPAARKCGGGRRAAAAELVAAEWAEAEPDEVSFGENVLELMAMERNARETTPCSLIRDPETISTPGSTTRLSHSNSHRRVQAPVRHIIPSSAEMNEFFAAAEQLQQQSFIERYNFDLANDCPLPGRYKWVKLD
ncbi:cyclin-dependent kinase inhibitor 4 [Brachypodium distachyon]|uniref:Cyclin-dependent kinase inhibitor n=1 Tax=Brachypodium distachyon TaxID=15368 RepID=I1I4L7_BRADI|nr:cyclin-dependent kinase inhibitor 4 [Brachypodium distachyon]KQJ97051.1 hypothetical protein BRADI_3g28507v3 [Brachypodium distachyon]|eukprot:XP_003574044.1 cyclin-dependent kinase inhibitor 4 [Brachypodium distachyon]